MNVGAQRNRAKRQRVSQVGGDIVSGGDRRSHLQSTRCKDVTEFAVRVFDESDACRPVWVVLDPDNFCRDTVLASPKINLAIFLFVPAANVTRCKPAVAVATAALLLRFNKTLFRPPLCDFIERGQRLETERRC